jgi:tetratricopeptide (TPR) repeat protein
MLALLEIRRGNLREADAAVKKGWENFDLQWQTYAGWPETHSILEAEAELALAQGELDRAARCVHQLLGKYEELKLQHFKPSVLYLQARVELAAGNKEDAHKTLCDALALSDEIGAHREVWEICWALSQLETERGNESAAIQMKERACTEVKLIADHAGTPELREGFPVRLATSSIGTPLTPMAVSTRRVDGESVLRQGCAPQGSIASLRSAIASGCGSSDANRSEGISFGSSLDSSPSSETSFQRR